MVVAVGSVSGAPVEVWPSSSTEDLQAAIRAVYRQVLGNPHMMESERLASAESQFCDGTLTVREFVRAIAKSDMYRARFFETSAPYRFVELNFKHLLGRAPNDQVEVSEHIRRCNEEGYDAEIDSYVDSNEYLVNFGENVVPYFCAATSQIGQKQVAYNRVLSLFRGTAEADYSVKGSKLVEAIATNATSKIIPPSSGGRVSPYSDATGKTFKIVVSGKRFGRSRSRRTTSTYIVSGGKMTPQIQSIQRSGGTILSITEVS
ncbi:MAG: phycobilisome rod-core linker polypeptide [Cyanobacteria bacterium P01_F01_bin.33]